MSSGMWTPSDYLLRSEFCPPSQIERSLQELRTNHNASLAVLITHDRMTVLRSLIFVSHEAPDTEDAIYSLLRTARRSDRQFIDDSRVWNVDGSEIRSLIVEPLAMQLGAELHMRSLPRSRISDESLSYWLISESDTLCKAAEDVSSPNFADMLNGTSVANVRRDQRIQRSVRGEDHSEVPEGSAGDVAPLLRLAIDVTGSAGAAFYVADRSAPRLRRHAEHELTPHFPVSVNLGRLESTNWAPADIAAVHIQESFRSGATRIFPPPFITDARRHHEESSEALPEVGSFICVPVPYAAKGLGIQLGVLAVYRDEPLQRVNMFDLALLRNVALRLSLLTTQSRSDEISSRTRDFTNTLNYGLSTDLDLSSPQSVSSNVPWDIQVAKATIQKIVNQLRDVTDSATVTFRVLRIRDQDPGGLVLTRLVSSPEGTATQEYADIPVPDSTMASEPDSHLDYSSNARVAYTGLDEHRADARHLAPESHRSSDFIQVPGRLPVRSYLTLPVQCGGAIVGTINLESPVPESYSNDRSTIGALAAQLGLAIAASRAQIMATALRASHRLVLGPHESGHVAQAVKAVRDHGHSAMAKAAEEIERYALRPPVKSGDPAIGAMTLEALLSQLFAELHSVTRDLRGPRDVRSLMLRRETTTTLAPILRELLQNQIQHADVDDARIRSPHAELVTIGGRRNLVLTFANRAEAPTAEIVAQLYNSPIDRGEDSRTNFGCFEVGNAVRSLGGLIFARVTPAGLLETSLFMPLEEELK
jgi:GAF domain-containing protein